MNEETKETLEWLKNVAISLALFIVAIATCFAVWVHVPYVFMKVTAVIQFGIDAYIFYLYWRKIFGKKKPTE